MRQNPRRLWARISQRTLRIIRLRRAIPLKEVKRRSHLGIINLVRHKIVNQIRVVKTSGLAALDEIVDDRVRFAIRAGLALR